MNDLPRQRQRLRLRYRKDDVLMYISHRDLLRFVLRLVRRTEIPFATSGKFSPKPRVSFGPALPLGVMADNELLDIELREGIAWELEDVKRCAKALKAATDPRDFVAGLTIVKHGTLPLGKTISTARYLLDYPDGSPMDEISELLSQDELTVIDRKDRTIDLKQVIQSWSKDGNVLSVLGNLAESNNLNVVLLAKLIAERTGLTALLLKRAGFLDNMGRQL